ncbi:MAG: DUF3141 domain-containing protein, partial [Hyphomicrobiaceae bacterium]
MANILGVPDPSREPGVPRPEADALDLFNRNMRTSQDELDAYSETIGILSTVAAKHSRRIAETHAGRLHTLFQKTQDLVSDLHKFQERGALASAWLEYQRDAAERTVLTADTFRKRGDIFLEHEAAGCPPVLVYDYEVILDGKDLPHPSNYMLLHIKPP